MPVRSATSPAAHPTRARVRSYRGFFSFLPFLSSFPFFTLRADGDCCGFDGVVAPSGSRQWYQSHAEGKGRVSSSGMTRCACAKFARPCGPAQREQTLSERSEEES